MTLWQFMIVHKLRKFVKSLLSGSVSSQKNCRILAQGCCKLLDEQCRADL